MTVAIEREAIVETEHRRRPAKRAWAQAALYVILIALALVIILPLVWMLITSFKTDADAIRAPYSFPDPFSLEAYQTLLTSDQQPIFLWLWNSFAAATVQTVLILVTASMARVRAGATGVPGQEGHLRRDHRDAPRAAGRVPDPELPDRAESGMARHDLRDHDSRRRRGVRSLLPAAVLRRTAPRDRGGGPDRRRGDIRIFLQVVLPLARPALATLAVLSFLGNWNDFLWPVYVLLSPEHLTLQPGLTQLQGAYSTHFAIVMAGAVIASVPVLILFAFAQRQVVESVAGSAVKG